MTLYTEYRADGPGLGTPPTLGTRVEIIARLGGYIGKSPGGPPGVEHSLVRSRSSRIALQTERTSPEPLVAIPIG